MRPNGVPSMRIACPVGPAEVLIALSSQAGVLSLANDQAFRIARFLATVLDVPPFATSLYRLSARARPLFQRHECRMPPERRTPP